MKTQKKLRVGIIFGGRSPEHEVSINSAKNVIAAVNKNKYIIHPIYIPKSGRFNFKKLQGLDVVFPVLHGPNGEDGTIQGLLTFMQIPFVGADVLGSAIGMDKDVMKRLLNKAGVPTAKFIVFKKGSKVDYIGIKRNLGSIVFVKPANLGSSIGISKARNKIQFDKAVKEAFKYDNKILVEEFINGREFECSVLGNDNPKCSVPGEIIVHDEFYTYKAKYLPNGMELGVPVKLNKTEVRELQAMAIKTYKVLCCRGMARVDFFFRKGKFIVDELNTIPGFTSTSVYPRLWQLSGLSYPKLIDKLIVLALKK